MDFVKTKRKGEMKKKGFNNKKIEEGVSLILQGIGENPEREGLKDTPKRVARFWNEFLSCPRIQYTSFSSAYDEMIIVKNISFNSMCEHHLLPFIGTVSLGYIPKNGRVLGLSKLVRIVYKYSCALQIQERMTQEIGQELEKSINPRGVGVRIEAQHLCMVIRGVKNVTSKGVTLYLSGAFRESEKARKEFLSQL